MREAPSDSDYGRERGYDVEYVRCILLPLDLTDVRLLAAVKCDHFWATAQLANTAAVAGTHAVPTAPASQSPIRNATPELAWETTRLTT